MSLTKSDLISYLMSIDPSELTLAQKDQINIYLEKENIRAARDSFHAFVLLMGPVLIDGFETGRHIEKICAELQQVSIDMWDKDGYDGPVRLQINLPPGAMKPVWEDTVVTMGDGSLKRIKHIVPGDTVITKEGRPRKVLAVHRQGHLNTLKITTCRGRSVIAAPDHPFLTPLGWKNAGDLTLEDSLAVPDRYSVLTLGKGMTANEAFLAGMLVGDGNITKSKTSINCSIEVHDDNLKERTTRVVEELGFGHQESKAGKRLLLSGGVRDWVRTLGIAGMNSHTKRVPDSVFNSPDEVVASFIGAYFDCDGCVSQRKTKKGELRDNFTLFFTSVSRGLLSDVQHLLSRLGMNFMLKEKNRLVGGYPYKSYELVCSDQDSCARFFERIPLHSRKAVRLAAHPKIRRYFNGQYFADRIVSIEDAGILPCMCLTVEEDASFLADGVVVHNSQLNTRMFPAWLLGKFPWTRVIIVGHGLDFAKDEYGEKIRDIMRSDEYQKIFPGTELRADKQTAGRFLTTDRGEVVCLSLGGKTAGRRAHIVIADDAIVEDDAKNKNTRTELVKKYIPNIRSRLLKKPRGAELNVGTCWSIGDLFSYLPEQDKNSGAPWRIVTIPALLTEAASQYMRNPDDPPELYAPGTSFWPEFMSTRSLIATKKSLENDHSQWQALYMQNPIPEDGAIIKNGWFKEFTHDESPDFYAFWVTADTAFTENTQSDYSSIQVWGLFYDKMHLPDGREVRMTNYMLVDHVKKKLDADTAEEIMFDMDKQFKPDGIIIEERSSGLVIGPRLQKRYCPVRLWKTNRDKYARMNAAAPFVKQGLFWLPFPQVQSDMDAHAKAAIQRVRDMSADFLNDMLIFPGGNHDDVVDAFSQMVLFLRENNLIQTPDYDYVNSPDIEEDDEELYNSKGGLYTSGLWT